MDYRLAKPSDLPNITDLIADSGLFEVDAASLDGVLLVAETKGTITGCFWACVCGRNAYLDHLVVSKEWRHSGIGPRLISHMMRTLYNFGVERIVGVVADEHKEMLKIYRAFDATMRSGYTVVSGGTGGA